MGKLDTANSSVLVFTTPNCDPMINDELSCSSPTAHDADKNSLLISP
ncbi:Uncharacterised protein [Vibrio cholerae]|nr:Uncharacterised protein [Vibrio cholerae]